MTRYFRDLRDSSLGKPAEETLRREDHSRGEKEEEKIETMLGNQVGKLCNEMKSKSEARPALILGLKGGFGMQFDINQ